MCPYWRQGPSNHTQWKFACTYMQPTLTQYPILVGRIVHPGRNRGCELLSHHITNPTLREQGDNETSRGVPITIFSCRLIHEFFNHFKVKGSNTWLVLGLQWWEFYFFVHWKNVAIDYRQKTVKKSKIASPNRDAKFFPKVASRGTVTICRAILFYDAQFLLL